jgi:hypothetical protein
VLLITRRPGSPSRLRGTFAVSVIACPSASRNTCGPPSGHVTYTAGGKTGPQGLLTRSGCAWWGTYSSARNCCVS